MGSLVRNFVVVIAMMPLLVSCSSMESKSHGSGPSKIQFLTKNMTPPDVTDKDAQVDEMYMHTQADYHFSRGEALSLDGDSMRAVEEFKLTLVYDPNSSAVRLRLADEYLKQGLLTEAVEQAEEAQKMDSENLEVHMFLGGLYSALKMYKQAHERYDFVMQKDPKREDVPLYVGALYADEELYDQAEASFLRAAQLPNAEKKHLAFYYIGKMRMGQGATQYKKAEKAFNLSLKDRPSFEEAALALGELYNAQNEKEKASKLLESFQEQYGPKKSVAYQLSQMYLEQENYEKAFKHLRILEAFEPKNLNVKVKIALIMIEKKDYENAIDKLEEIIVMAPSSDKIRFYLAAVYEETSHPDQAIRNFRKIEATSTYYPDAVIHAAYLLRKKNDISGSRKLLESALAAREDVPQFYSFYASILDEQKEYARGISVLEKAVVKFPDNTQILFYLGSIYDRVHRSDETISQMKKILTLDAKHVQAMNYLAYTYAEMGQNLEEAEKLARRANEIQPNDGYILDTLGWSLFKQGRVEESIKFLEQAYRSREDESIIAEHLGDAYYVFELADKAHQMYLRAVEHEEDPSKITKLRAKISSLELQTKGRTPAAAATVTGH